MPRQSGIVCETDFSAAGDVSAFPSSGGVSFSVSGSGAFSAGVSAAGPVVRVGSVVHNQRPAFFEAAVFFFVKNVKHIRAAVNLFDFEAFAVGGKTAGRGEDKRLPAADVVVGADVQAECDSAGQGAADFKAVGAHVFNVDVDVGFAVLAEQVLKRRPVPVSVMHVQTGGGEAEAGSRGKSARGRKGLAAVARRLP